MSVKSEPPLVREILRYCLRNPRTADTPEGFARWRLMEEFVNRTTAETAEALDWLESRGYLRKVATLGSEHFFTLNETRLTEVADFLAILEPNGGATPQAGER